MPITYICLSNDYVDIVQFADKTFNTTFYVDCHRHFGCRRCGTDHFRPFVNKACCSRVSRALGTASRFIYQQFSWFTEPVQRRYRQNPPGTGNENAGCRHRRQDTAVVWHDDDTREFRGSTHRRQPTNRRVYKPNSEATTHEEALREDL